MANSLFDSYKRSLLGSTADFSARVDLDTDTIKALFVDHADDTPAPATDVFVSGIASAARVPAFASAPTLTTPTISATGVWDAADLVFTALSGDQVESLVIFKNVTVDTDSPLLIYFDTFTAGMPLTPNGADVTIIWNASGILAL